MKKTIYYTKQALLLIAIIYLSFASITLAMGSSVVADLLSINPMTVYRWGV